MPGSPSSSDRRTRAGLLAAIAVCIALAAPGCVTVRPEEREFLADRSMTFGGEGDAEAHEAHVLSNREGSYGATGATGGGCGCN